MTTVKKGNLKITNAKIDSKREERRATLEPAVLGVVSALGGYEDVFVNKQKNDQTEVEENEEQETSEQVLQTERVYKLGDECLGCLKDLKKFWRLDEDDENRTVARILHSSQILPNDLLPILLSVQTENRKDYRVALLSADLIAALTWPIDIASELKEAFEIEDEETWRQATNVDYSTLIDAQLSYKRHIVRTAACGPIFRLILPAIQKNKNERTEKDDKVISLILHIIRNLLAIRDKTLSTSQPVSGMADSYLQSDLIIQLSKFGVFDLLIHMSHESNRFNQYGQWNMIVLDIWHMLFRGVDSEDLIDAEACVGTNESGEKILTTKLTDKKLESLLLDEEKARKVKARNSSTRHSRFGTTLTVKAGDKRFNLHSQSAITTPVEIALDSRKKSKRKPARLANEFGRSVNLTPDALKVLRSVVIEFIESGFNPFFRSVMEEIKMQTRDTDAVRLLSLLAFFFNCFLKLRDREKSVGILPTSEAGHDFDLVADLIAPECLMWVVDRIQVGLDQKPVMAVEVHAGVDCAIQQLLVIEGLSQSGVAEYEQTANIILNRLYYDLETLNVVIDLMSKYTDQSLKYLENIVHFSFVFLKILEKYSQSTDYMYVRKKKANRKSTNPQQLDNFAEGNLDDEIETGITPVDDEEQAYLNSEANKTTFTEHKFEFSKFQFRFATTAVVDTLMTYLRGYHHFTNPELMKRVVKLMYRQAVGAEAHELFFRVSILDTFNSIIEDKVSIPKHQVYADLMRLIDYILKQYFKCLEERPFLIVETLFKHSKQAWNRALYSSDDSADMPSKRRKIPKLPAEVVIQPGLRWAQKFGVAVGVLVDKGQSDFVEKVKDILRIVSASRAAIVLMNDEIGNDLGSVNIQAWLEHPHEEISEELKSQLHRPSPSTLEKFEDHKIIAEDDVEEFKEALARNAQLHTLLRLLHWESEEENPGFLGWKIPKVRTHSELDVDIQVIDHFLINPLDLDGKSAAEFTKKKRSKRKTKRSELTADELALDNSSENDAPLGPSKRKRQVKQKRSKRSDLTAEESALDESSAGSDDDARERKKVYQRNQKLKERKQYLSAQFVADSDDEENEERDRLFFEQERKLMAQKEQAALLHVPEPLRPKKIKKKTGPSKQDSESVADEPREIPDREQGPLSTFSPISEADDYADPARGNQTVVTSPSQSSSSVESLKATSPTETTKSKRDVEMTFEKLNDPNIGSFHIVQYLPS